MDMGFDVATGQARSLQKISNILLYMYPGNPNKLW